jgi:hypothetical protein
MIGDDDQPVTAGMTANLHVMRTAGRSGRIQFGSNLTVMRGCLGPEQQHVETRHEIFDCEQVVGPARRFLRAICNSPSVTLEMQSCSASELNFSRMVCG